MNNVTIVIAGYISIDEIKAGDNTTIDSIEAQTIRRIPAGWDEPSFGIAFEDLPDGTAVIQYINGQRRMVRRATKSENDAGWDAIAAMIERDASDYFKKDAIHFDGVKAIFPDPPKGMGESIGKLRLEVDTDSVTEFMAAIRAEIREIVKAELRDALGYNEDGTIKP